MTMMFEEPGMPGGLQPKELEAVYAISQAVARSVDVETVLQEITQIARPVFIFDNIVLYLGSQDSAPEPAFARAIGRGRFREADLAWGEAISNEAIHTNQVITRIETMSNVDEDRTNVRFFLGLPLHLGGQVIGALVFIRFGGPPYTPEQVHLAEFIAVHVAQLIEHRQLVERIASLEARRKLDSLQDDFIAMISHELLTPLGFIKGYATTLMREDAGWDNDARREFLTIIDEETDRLRELIDNLLDSSRLQAGTLHMNLQPVRLDTLLKDIALRASTREDKLKIALDLRANTLQTQADPARLAQVFDNLMSNAAKYAPDSLITLSLERSKGMAHITVRDAGPGIAPEHVEKLFSRFYRAPGTNTNIRGTGLGLYICRKIIEAHQGEIHAESQPGVGTSIHIYLPYTEIS